MRIRQYWMTLALFTLAGAVPVVHAQSREDRFREWDRNGDGRLEIGEFTGHPGNFKAMDCDKDGYLNMNEFSQRYRCGEQPTAQQPTLNERLGQLGPPPAQQGTLAETIGRRSEERFDRLDRNADDAVSRGEWNGTITEFRRLDRNNDSMLSRSEWVDQLDPNSAEGRFQASDQNDDGVLSRREWSETVSFDRVDRNNDDVVTLNEYTSRPATGSREARFDVLDRNDDGVLSRVEWRGETVRFPEADRNGDNRVTFEEYMNLPAARYDSRSGDTSSDTYGRFSGLDRNRDGIVSRTEWTGDGLAFNILDSNRDGVISSVEYADRSSIANRFDTVDRSRDGWISRSEWAGDDDMFNRLDTNRDGRVSRAEFLQL